MLEQDALMEGVEPTAVGERAQARLWEERSARFVSWVTLDDQPLTDAYVQAVGVTDFRRLETRCDQRLGAAIFEDGRDQVRRSRNPLDRVTLMGTMWLARLIAHPEQIRHYFYADGLSWQLFEGHWVVTSSTDPLKPGFRAGRDPALIVESLAVITAISEVTPNVIVGGQSTRWVRAVADLSAIDARLDDLLSAGDGRSRTRGWYESAPVELWIDDTGLPRRLKYAPLAPQSRSVLWRTIEFTDFGAQLDAPEIARG